MKKAKLMLIFTIVCFAFIPKVFATNYMSVSKENVKVGESFDINVNFDSIEAWEINVTTTGPVGECSILEENATQDNQNVPKEFKTTCNATEAGTITITLSGNVTKAKENEEENDIVTTLNETLTVTVTPEEEQPKGLASLSVTNGTLSPSFNSNTNTGYVITLDSTDTTTFSISAVAKTETDTIIAKRENGDNYEIINLSNINFITGGNNSTMLIVISVGEGKRLLKYEIQVVKPIPPQIEPPVLSMLAIDGHDINLISGQYEYEITLDDKDSYFITATIKDTTNYRFDEFLVPPVDTSSKDIEIGIKPKDPSAGLESRTYHIVIKTNSIEPITQTPTTTTKKPSGGGGNGNIENPQTGSTSVIIVAIILISSLIISMHLYKKNINGYN